MKRRDFLKGLSAGAGACLLGTSYFAHAKESKEAKERRFNLNLVSSAQFNNANELKLYLPLCLSNETQIPRNLKIEGNYASYELIGEKSTPLLYAKWNVKEENAQEAKSIEAKLGVNIAVDIKETKILNVPEGDYISQNRYIRTDGEIANIVNSLVKDTQSPIQKAQTIFAWISNNISLSMAQNQDGIRGIYSKDGRQIMRGDNINASSVFVAACRACGIPAVEAFGFSLDSGRYNLNPKQSQPYTRSAILINNQWIPNDVILAIASNNQSRNILNYSFKTWDNNWALFNFSRDHNLLINNENLLFNTVQFAFGFADSVNLRNYQINHFNHAIYA